MKLLGSTKSKITKDKDGENMPNLKFKPLEIEDKLSITY